MTTLQALMRRHAVLAYFALIFAISWGDIVIDVGSASMPIAPEQSAEMPPFVLSGAPCAAVFLACPNSSHHHDEQKIYFEMGNVVISFDRYIAI